MKKPLSVTSPTHAMGLAVYFMLGLFGFLGVFNAGRSSALIGAMGQGNSDVWATTLMIGGWGALISAIASSRARRPEYNMRWEKVFCILLCFNLSYVVWIAISVFGDRLFTSVMFGGTFAIGAGLRAYQLWMERKKIKKARQHPEVVTDELLADPDKTDG